MNQANAIEGDLTPEDIAQVTQLQRQTEEWLAKGHTITRYSMVTDEASRFISQRAWSEFIRRAHAARWEATIEGTNVIVKLPPLG